MRQIDSKVILALAAPTGFVVFSSILFYSLKALKTLSGFAHSAVEVFMVYILAAVLGSYLGPRLLQTFLKQDGPLIRLSIGALLGYELGLGIELWLFSAGNLAFSARSIYFFALVVLLCGYLGALIGLRFNRKKVSR